jgi:catechol 2,3-dioxygenase-like lactoylglutathione lyase family enzyme
MRLNQVTVSVRDIDEAIAFYRRLGLRLIVRSPHYARFVCPDGAVAFPSTFASQGQRFTVGRWCTLSRSVSTTG